MTLEDDFEVSTSRPVDRVSEEEEQRERDSARKRVHLLVAGAVAAVAVGALMLLLKGIPANLVGYIFGTVVSLLLVASARRTAGALEQRSGASLAGSLAGLMLSLIVCAVVLAGFHAYFIARHIPLPGA